MGPLAQGELMLCNSQDMWRARWLGPSAGQKQGTHNNRWGNSTLVCLIINFIIQSSILPVKGTHIPIPLYIYETDKWWENPPSPTKKFQGIK